MGVEFRSSVGSFFSRIRGIVHPVFQYGSDRSAIPSESSIEVFGFAKKKPSVPFCPGRCGRNFSGQKRHSAFLPQNSPERGGSRPLRVLYDIDYLIPKRRMQRFGANQNLVGSSVL